VYCVTASGISSADVSATVAVDFTNTASPVGLAQASLGADAGICPPNSFRVVTQRITFNSVTLTLNDAFVNDVSFTIVIP
jgi:hypothetical protein